MANVDGEVSLLQRDVDMSRTSLHPQPIVAYFINMDTEAAELQAESYEADPDLVAQDRRRAHMEQQVGTRALLASPYDGLRQELQSCRFADIRRH